MQSLFYDFAYSHRRQGKENVTEETILTCLSKIINQVKGLLVGRFNTRKLDLLIFHFPLCLAVEHVNLITEIVPIIQFRTAVFRTDIFHNFTIFP